MLPAAQAGLRSCGKQVGLLPDALVLAGRQPRDLTERLIPTFWGCEEDDRVDGRSRWLNQQWLWLPSLEAGSLLFLLCHCGL